MQVEVILVILTLQHQEVILVILVQTLIQMLIMETLPVHSLLVLQYLELLAAGFSLKNKGEKGAIWKKEKLLQLV